MRRRLTLGLALGAVLLASGCDPESQDASRSQPNSAPASPSASPSAPPSAPPSGSAGILDASWVAPTTNTDGSSLTDLAFYRLYYSTASTPCGQPSVFQVASPTPSPQINETVTYRLTGLWTGARYFVAITAVDSSGFESACSPVADAVARSAGSTANQLSGSPATTGASGGSAFAIQVPVSTLTALTAESGPTVTFTATAAGGTAPYQFKWWLWNGATWTVLEDWSTANTFAWTPSTPNPNSAVGVWVRSAGNTADQPDGYPAYTGAYGVIPFAI